MTTEALDKPKGPCGAEPRASSRETMREILKRAEGGDEECLAEVRALLGDSKGGSRIVERFGSPAHWLQSRLIQDAAGDNLVMREAAEKKLADLRRELEGPSPTALERLLVERAALCWFTVHLCELRYAVSDGLTIKQAEYRQRTIDHAHTRFLSSLRTLATIRKLALPALQVNIGATQVNVAGP